MLWEWEEWEKERDLYPRPIKEDTQGLLRNVGLYKYYEEAQSLKGHFGLLVPLISRWDVRRQAFRVYPGMWYRHTEEDIYFITVLSRKGDYFPQFPDVALSVAVDSQLIYSQKYIGHNVVYPGDF